MRKRRQENRKDDDDNDNEMEKKRRERSTTPRLEGGEWRCTEIEKEAYIHRGAGSIDIYTTISLSQIPPREGLKRGFSCLELI
jgi:hypothetical protein